MTHALRAVPKMDPGVYLAVNCSHRAAVSTDLATLIEPLADRLVLEITEHEAVEDYDDLVDALAPLRARGARVAIDDAGAGFASLRHTVRIAPDIVKLDMSLTRDIDTDRAKRALADGASSRSPWRWGSRSSPRASRRRASSRRCASWAWASGKGSSSRSPDRFPDRSPGNYSPARRSIAHDEVSDPFVYCFISVATATASA